MGLLDDAIREHLELKRRGGADPEDLDRQEREALGPVVRADDLATDVTSDEADGIPSEYEPVAGDLVDAYDHEFEHLAEPEADPHRYVEHEPVAGDEHAAAPPEAPAHAGQPTEEFDVEAAHVEEAGAPASEAAREPHREPAADQEQHQPAPAEGEHDVLEETPDFLQETPEHDRLWFEQAPPQDFDFDK